jgi:hypothetical protein
MPQAALVGVDGPHDLGLTRLGRCRNLTRGMGHLVTDDIGAIVRQIEVGPRVVQKCTYARTPGQRLMCMTLVSCVCAPA